MKHSTLFFLATCVGLMMHAQVPSYVPTDGLVGWYPFNGNANDESGVSEDGEMFSLEAAEDRFGNANSAFYFNGSGCNPHIETNIDFQGSSEGMTISYWLNRQGNGCIYPRLFGFWSGGNNPQSWGMAWGNSAVLDYMGESPANNQWHHVLVTLDADSIHAYLNGELKGSFGSSKQPPLASYMSIGRMTHPAYDAFNGYMDDFGIWNRILLPEEIESMYESDDNPSIAGCMDETACNYIPQGLTASQYTDSLGYSVATLISSGYEPANLIGMEYGGGLIYNIEEQGADLVISIVHPPEYADAPVPNMGLNPGSACGAGGQFGGSFLNAPEQCANLVLEGYDDWFLPTIEQVQQVYETLFYSAEFPVNVCATGASGYFKGVDYLSATETCRCYFGTGEVLCNAPAGNAYEYFPVRQTLIPALPPSVECEFGCEYCGPGTSWDAIAQMCVVATSPYLNDPGEAAVINPCYFDSDQSGIVDVTDLMNVLSVYGLACGEIPEAAEFSCGESLDYFGYEYATVQIGQQCWFAENLRVESYSNGESIPNGLDDVDWYTTSQGAMTAYGEGASTCNNYVLALGDACDETVSIPEYGRLYNWHAVADERGLCPSGWHVPSDLEWITLELQLGMASSEVNGTGWRGTDQGSQLKNEDGWFQNGAGSNSSGFSGLPAGDRTNSIFVNAGTYGTFWSSTETDGSTAWDRFIGYDDQRVYRTSYTKQSGFSVRCLQNTNNNE